MPFLDLLAAFSGSEDISLGCTTALLSLTVFSSAGSCLNAGVLTPFVSAVSSASMILPTTAYLNGFCPLPLCSDDQIQSVVDTVLGGCSSDIKNYGITLPSTTELVSIAQETFPTFKQALCLQESISGSETNCIINILDAFQQNFGAILTVEDLIADIDNVINDSTQLPKSITCSTCMEDEMLLMNSTFPIFFSWFELFPTVEEQCGSGFISPITGSSSSVPASTANATASENPTLSGALKGLGSTVTGTHTSSTLMPQSASTSSDSGSTTTTSTSTTLVLSSVAIVSVLSVTLTLGATTNGMSPTTDTLGASSQSAHHSLMTESILPSSSSPSDHTYTDTFSIPSPSILISITQSTNAPLPEITSTLLITSTAPLSSPSSSTSTHSSFESKSKSTTSNTLTTTMTTLVSTFSSNISATRLAPPSVTLPASATAINTTSTTTTNSVSFLTSLAGDDTTALANSKSPSASTSGSAPTSQASSNAQTDKGLTAASMALLFSSFALTSVSYI